MASRETRSGRAFTLLELVIVICIVALLVAFALERLLGLRVEAERVVLEEVLGALRAGVAMEMVSLVVKGADRDLLRVRRGPASGWSSAIGIGTETGASTRRSMVCTASG